MKEFKEVYSEKNGHRLHHIYYPYPPEMLLYYYIHLNKCYNNNNCNKAIDIYDEEELASFGYKAEMNYKQFFSDLDIQKYLNLKLQEFIELEKQDKLNLLLSKNVNKVDIYSLGVSIVDCLEYTDNTMMNKKINKFIHYMIHPDVEKRYTPNQALTQLLRLIKYIN
jgi:hypothetical protein